MRVLILAAGKGTRISRYLGGRPKCTVDIGGIELIRYTVTALKARGIQDIGIVLGYDSGTIRGVLKDFDIKYYYNPFYDVTNSIASVWFAQDFLREADNTFIMNGDVYLSEILIDRILRSDNSPVMFADGTRREEADYKFRYNNGLLEKYGKDLTGDDISGEYIGVGRFAADFMPVFLKELNLLINTQRHSLWWENVVYELIPEIPVRVESIDGMFWAEVDYIEDYERILKFRENAP